MQRWLSEHRPRSIKKSNHYRMLRFPISPYHQLDPYISNTMGHCINRNILLLVQEHSLFLQEFMLGNLIYVCVHSCSVVSNTLSLQWTVVLQASLTMGFPRQDSEVGCYFLPWGVFPTKGSNLGLLCVLHCRWILYPLSHQGRSLSYFWLKGDYFPYNIPSFFQWLNTYYVVAITHTHMHTNICTYML